MDKINFQNHKSGGTPVNAANLNQMQDNIENAINEVSTKHFYYYSADSIEWFKNWAISEQCPPGISFWHVTLGGVVSCIIVTKASNSYLSFIQFSYAIDAIQYKYKDGTWSTKDL